MRKRLVGLQIFAVVVIIAVGSKFKIARDFAFDNLLPTMDYCYIESFGDISLLGCAMECLVRLPVCAGMVYNDILVSCRLLRCHLNEKLVNRTQLTEGWKYFANNHACDSGWIAYDGHCYLDGGELLSWNDSKIKCGKNGGYLLEVQTEEENTWVTNVFLTPPSDCPDWRECTVWMAASDEDTEGTFTWFRSKEKLTYLPWKSGQPDDNRGQDCIRIQYTGKWIDAGCGEPDGFAVMINFICEKEWRDSFPHPLMIV